MSKEHQSIGEWGEYLAECHLRKLKYTILKRNWQASRAEVDIIVEKDDVLIFVEVKTRHIRQYKAAQSVSEKQRSHLAKAASMFMREIGHEWEIRFDLIEVRYHDRENYELHHYEDFFYPGWEYGM